MSYNTTYRTQNECEYKLWHNLSIKMIKGRLFCYVIAIWPDHQHENSPTPTPLLHLPTSTHNIKSTKILMFALLLLFFIIIVCECRKISDDNRARPFHILNVRMGYILLFYTYINHPYTHTYIQTHT